MVGTSRRGRERQVLEGRWLRGDGFRLWNSKTFHIRGDHVFLKTSSAVRIASNLESEALSPIVRRGPHSVWNMLCS